MSEDVGYPVMLGRIGDQACLLWESADPAAEYRLLVEHGKVGLFHPATEVVSLDLVGGSPLTLPGGAVPPFSGTDACFQGEFMATVVSTSGERLGGELWRTCEHHPVLADGCVGPERQLGVHLGRLPNPDGTDYSDTRCITWEDRFDDETGFRSELRYAQSGERFVYEAPADTVEFLPPPADVDGLGEFRAPDLRRKDYAVMVWALRPSGETLVGSIDVQVM
ncbi:MAG: hypothetical protein WD557_06630 [Dehalococcoidia bacterium]